MNTQAKITKIEVLPGEFLLVDLALSHAETGELIEFSQWHYRAASLPFSDQTKRQLLCYKPPKFPVNTDLTVQCNVLPKHAADIIVGQDHGIAAAISLAKYHKAHKPLVLLSSSTVFPFLPQPSKILIPDMPADVIAASPLLDDWGIPNRLVSQVAMPGCFHGEPVALLEYYLHDKKHEDLQITIAGSEDFINNVASGVRTEYLVI